MHLCDGRIFSILNNVVVVGVRGLPQSGWQPIASTFVHLESLETQKSFSTEYKKNSSSILWGENMPMCVAPSKNSVSCPEYLHSMDLKDSSKVRFEVRSHMLWNRTVLGKTEPYSVHDLMEKQKEAGDEHDACEYMNLISSFLNCAHPACRHRSRPIPGVTHLFAAQNPRARQTQALRVGSCGHQSFTSNHAAAQLALANERRLAGTLQRHYA